jgi:hypothetical protein
LTERDRIEIRPAREDDRSPVARLFAAVAEERDGIAAEPPIDVERAASFRLDESSADPAAATVLGNRQFTA